VCGSCKTADARVACGCPRRLAAAGRAQGAILEMRAQGAIQMRALGVITR